MSNQLSITINVPPGYRYMARQFDGDICFFKEKPVIANHLRDNNNEVEYWVIQEDEISLFGDDNILLKYNMTEDWRESLIDFGFS